MLLGAADARAHDADLISIEVSAGTPTRERATMTVATLSLVAPIQLDAQGQPRSLEADRPAIEAGFWNEVPLRADAGPCTLNQTRAEVRGSLIDLFATWRCPAPPTRQTFRILSVLPAGYRVVVHSEGAGERFAQGIEQEISLPRKEDARLPLGGWVGLGVFHILTGYDHLCFLLALLVAATGWRQILVLVTSFTVAHSITLGATALGAIRLTAGLQRGCEVAIAGSIVFVGIQNLVSQRQAHRPLVTFAFGLVHGFGFASALREYGFRASPGLALFGFNLGVEFGQACVVAVVFPLLLLSRRAQSARQWLPLGVSVTIVAAGAYWFVDRLFA